MSSQPIDQGPTNSDPINKILGLAQRVLAEQATASELQALLAERLELCQEYQRSYEEKGRERGQRFLDEHGAVLQQVLLHLQYFEKGLHHIEEFCRTRQLGPLEEGRRILVEMAGPLKGVLEYYGHLYMTFGPSDYPLMNTVLMALQEILDGQRPPEQLEAVVANAITYHELGVQEMDESAEATGEGFEAKKKAYREVISSLQNLRPVQSVPEIETATRPLQLALEAITSADERILNEHLASRPTDMPSANIVINVLKGGLDGVYEPEQLQDALQWYRKVAEDLEDQFEVAVEGETRSVTIREELPRFRELLDRHDEILEDLEHSSSALDREDIESLLEEFEEVVGGLSQSARIFVEAAEREGKILCVKCGHANSSENRNCGECGFRLPKMAGMSANNTLDLKERGGVPQQEEDEPPYVLGQNTYRLLEAAGLFHEGSIDENAFRALLEESRKMVESSDIAVERYNPQDLLPPHMKDVLSDDQLESLDESEELLQEAKYTLQDGIDEWMEALDIFEQYIETRHYPLVEKGCEALFHASQKMHEVARLGDKTGTELEELAQGRGGPVEEILPSVDDQLEEEPDYTLAPVDQTDYSTLDDRPVG